MEPVDGGDIHVAQVNLTSIKNLDKIDVIAKSGVSKDTRNLNPASQMALRATFRGVFMTNFLTGPSLFTNRSLRSKNGVSTGPGHTAVTLILRFFNSPRSALEKERT